MMIGGSKKKKDESDDEICVVEEKITDKARKRAEHRKRLIAQKRKQIMEQRALAARQKNAPKTVIKVNSPHGKQLLKKIATTGSIPKTMLKQKPVAKKFNNDDDEEDLTCPICLSSFWYPNQKAEHMKSAHNNQQTSSKVKGKAKK